MATVDPSKVVVQPAVVQAQPIGGAQVAGGMAVGAAPPVVAAAGNGLDPLIAASGFYVRQKVQWLEELTGFEQANKYQVFMKPQGVTKLEDAQIKQLPMAYRAVEESECFERQCCFPNHSFKMNVTDSLNQSVLQFDRPFSCFIPCTYFCFGCIINPRTMQVMDGQGNPLGMVREAYRTMSCKMGWVDVFDKDGIHKFTLEAPCCQCGPNCICTTFEFVIYEGPECDPAKRVGTLMNVFPGCNAKGLCTKADNLELEWDKPLEIQDKSLLLATCFMIDFLWFEKRDDDGNNGAMGGGF